MLDISARKRLMVLLAAALFLLGLAVALRWTPDASIRPTDVQPPGRWSFQSDRLSRDTGEDLARLLSLPYMSGTMVASDQAGVLAHDPERAFEGLNLYVSGHAPEAVLLDMQGNLVHRWSHSFESAFPDKRPSPETDYFRRVHPFANGDLLVLFQGGGMIKLDRDSRLLWTSDLPFYNHLFVTEEGTILSIAKTAKVISELRPEPVLEDSIVTLDAEGRLLSRLSLLECFRSSPFAGLLQPLPDHADIFHSNTVVPIERDFDPDTSPLRRGDVLVSLREVDTVAIVDPDAASVRAAWRGPWRAQHQPIPTATGTILLFDNKGAGEGSRVLEFDPLTTRVMWEYPGDRSQTLWSPEAGSCQILGNGNTLITESERGRALEITPEGEVVWEFASPHRAGRRGELVATLFEVVRLPRSELTFPEAARPES